MSWQCQKHVIYTMSAIGRVRFTRFFTNYGMFEVTRNLTVQSMSNAWYVKKVIPDVIPEVPPCRLGVEYPGITINEGTIVKPRQVKDPPTVHWKAKDETCMFTLLMIDPDAPSRSLPKYRFWLHWMVVNIPGNQLEKGETLAEYIGAGPPKGTDLHRYVFLLYGNPKATSFSETKLLNNTYEGRRSFGFEKFVVKYNLGEPSSGNFFMAEHDDYVPELYKQIKLEI